jgi:integrase
MDRRVLITESILKRVLLKAAGPGQRVAFSDTELKGFSVRIDGPVPTRPDASQASFYAASRINGEQIRRHCGVYGDASRDSRLVNVRTARARADKFLAEMKLGLDTRPKRAVTVVRAPDLFEDVAARYFDYLERTPRKGGGMRAAGYITATKSYFDRLPWQGRDIHSITRADVRKALETFERADKWTASRRCLSALKAFFGWALRQDLVSVSPAAGVVAESSEVKRDRVLSNDEIRIIWRACDELGSYAGALVKTMLLTGQRRGEVARLRHNDIDAAGVWKIDAEQTKAGRTHLVPLAPFILRLISNLKPVGSGIYVFGPRPRTGFADLKARLDLLSAKVADELGLPRLEPWHIHDLRRSCATGMRRLGVAQFAVARVLNHAPEGVTGQNYDWHDALPEKRAALEVWARHIQSLVGENVVDLEGARVADGVSRGVSVA